MLLLWPRSCASAYLGPFASQDLTPVDSCAQVSYLTGSSSLGSPSTVPSHSDSGPSRLSPSPSRASPPETAVGGLPAPAMAAVIMPAPVAQVCLRSRSDPLLHNTPNPENLNCSYPARRLCPPPIHEPASSAVWHSYGTRALDVQAVLDGSESTSAVVEPGISKRCSFCKSVKILEAFYAYPITTDGRRPRCKVCTKKVPNQTSLFLLHSEL